jgi:c-di-GMP-binding flagellar brake protein YcgR
MEYHEPTPSILLLHDGELTALAAVIESLGGIDRRGEPTESDRTTAWDVIIASASRMLELHEHLPETSAVRIAVLDGDSKTLRKMLYRADTDLMVRQPVHHIALRLLILHALYRGPEKRRTTRVSVGASVRFRIGMRNRTAVLAELSTRGCRLVAEQGCHRATPDRLMKVVLPPQVTNDERSFSIRGHVLRVSSAEPGVDVIAVIFEMLREKARKRLESVVLSHSHGPAVFDDAVSLALRSVPIVPEDSEPQSPDLDDPIEEVASERRIQERHTLSRRIVALGEEAARVLIGRDLSVGGMRIDSTPGIALGDRLKVAVHVRPDGQPLVVSAEIARDDGPEGMALRFVDLSPAARAYLEEMVFALPAIVDSNSSEEDAGLVVSEVVGRRAS